MDEKSYAFSASGESSTCFGRCSGGCFVAEITLGLNLLYLYTDLVEHKLVGAFAVPLLCCVLTGGNNNDIVIVTYDKLHYVLVNHQHINMISIEIKTDQNKHISLCFGKMIGKLHLCPRKPLIF